MMPQPFAIVVFLPATLASKSTLKFRHGSHEFRVKSSSPIMQGAVMPLKFEVRRDGHFTYVALENPIAMLFIEVMLFLGATRKKGETYFAFFAVYEK